MTTTDIPRHANSSTGANPPGARRWGAWATLAWSALIGGVFLLTQVMFFSAYVGHRVPDGADLAQEARRLQYDGDVLALATLLTAFLCVPLIIGIAKLKRGSRLADYLPLVWPAPRVLGFWLLVLVLFIAASDLMSWLTGHPIVPEFMTEAYASADSKLLLWAGIAVGAPLLEELFFRGFLYAGLAPSRLGAAGAVVCTALFWALVHVQYDWYGVTTIFVIGLLLGLARAKTGTLVIPLLLHVAANSFAVAQTAVFLGAGLAEVRVT